MTEASYIPSITGVILAGGRARRMGGDDKGLIPFQNRPLIKYAINAIRPQVDRIIINANRNLERYQNFGYRVISDSISDFQGPLAGMLAALQQIDTDYMLTVPCDSPFIPAKYRQRMMECLLASGKRIAVATDSKRLQPVFCLIHHSLKDNLQQFVGSGQRKIDSWLRQQDLAVVDFSDHPDCFININEPADLSDQRATVRCELPMLGFAAYSGTGKTTLLTRLIPELRERGLRVGVIKHAHHKFDVDKPGKDSYQIREAGAQQILIASSRLIALMETNQGAEQEPLLAELLPRLDITKLDLILVEGFKHEKFAKIELHRPSLGQPLLFHQDPLIQAIATDAPLETPEGLTVLDLNDVAAIADYILQFSQQWTR